MKLRQFLGIINGTFILTKRNYRKFWLPVLLDSAFFVILGMVWSPFYNIISAELSSLGGIAVREASKNLQSFLSVILVSSQAKKIMIYLAFFAVILYFLYCSIQGIVWRICLNFRKRGRFWQYIFRFFTVNLLWYLFFWVFIILDFIFYYLDTEAARFEPGGLIFLSYISKP